MTWYLDIKTSQTSEEFQQWGVPQSVADYISGIQDNNLRGQLVNQVRKNPQIPLQDLQNYQMPQRQDPNTEYEHQLAARFPPQAHRWVLANLRKLRQGKVPPYSPEKPGLSVDYPEFTEYVRAINTLDRLARTNEIADLLRFNPNIDINSYDIDDASDLAAEWHQVMSGKGEGLIYGPTDQNLVVYGPNWSNPEWQGWTIQEVRSENDLLAEGNMMGHCVGGYCKDVQGGRSRIFSLRDPNNEPHVTMEASGSDWEFRQILGDGPMSGNADPSDNYKAMIREWFKTIDDDSLSYGSEENEALEELSNGYYDTRDTSVSEMVQRALSWYEEENEYGIPNNRDMGVRVDFEEIFDAAISGQSTHGSAPHPHHFGGVGEVLVDQALAWDLERFNGDLSYETLMKKGAESMAGEERRNRFFTLKKDKTKPGSPGRWSQTDEQARAYVEYMKPWITGEHYSDTWVSDQVESRHDEQRAIQLLEQAQQDPAILEELNQRAIEAYDRESYFGQVMTLREEKEQEFTENYYYYNEGEGYPQEEDFENEEDYSAAVEEFEENEAWNMEYARDENVEAYVAHKIYEEAVNQFAKYDIEIPEWILKGKTRNGSRPDIAWISQQGRSKREEKAAGSFRKLFAGLRHIPSAKPRDVARVLNNLGYRLIQDRGKGSHTVWKHPDPRVPDVTFSDKAENNKLINDIFKKQLGFAREDIAPMFGDSGKGWVLPILQQQPQEEQLVSMPFDPGGADAWKNYDPRFNPNAKQSSSGWYSKIRS